MIGDSMRNFVTLFLVFLLCGCSKSLNIQGEITEIKYNDIYINEDDFNNVKNLINTRYSKKEDKDLANKLTIKTTDEIYYFSLSDDEIKYDGKVGENTKLNTYLQKLTKKYTNTDFYTIDYMKNFETDGDDEIIILDKTSNYVVINFGEKVINFKINEIEMENGKFTDVDLLYSEENVNKRQIIIRKSISNETDIRISFENKYGYVISIVPIYNNDKDIVEFKNTGETK